MGIYRPGIEKTDSTTGSTPSSRISSPWGHRLLTALDAVDAAPPETTDASVGGDERGSVADGFRERETRCRSEKRDDDILTVQQCQRELLMATDGNLPEQVVVDVLRMLSRMLRRRWWWKWPQLKAACQSHRTATALRRPALSSTMNHRPHHERAVIAAVGPGSRFRVMGPFCGFHLGQLALQDRSLAILAPLFIFAQWCLNAPTP